MRDDLFVLIQYRWPEPVPACLFNLKYSDLYVSDEFVDGYWIQRLKDIDGQPPMTGAAMAFNTLTYGNSHPTVIWSSEGMKKYFMKLFKPGHVTPRFYDGSYGFQFYGVPWIDKDFLRDTNTVVMLNENNPMNPRLNGCYAYTLPM
jgi:hypothetical protein